MRPGCRLSRSPACREVWVQRAPLTSCLLQGRVRRAGPGLFQGVLTDGLRCLGVGAWLGKKVKWPLGLVPACSLWAGCNYLGSGCVGQCQTDATTLRIWVCGVNSCRKIVLSLSLLGKRHRLALGFGVPPICISSTTYFQVFPTNSNRFIFCCNSAHTQFLEKPFPSLNGMAAAFPVLFHSCRAVVHNPQLKSPLLAPCAFVFFNFHSHRDFKREVGRAGFQLHSWRMWSCCVPSLTLSPAHSLFMQATPAEKRPGPWEQCTGPCL